MIPQDNLGPGVSRREVSAAVDTLPVGGMLALLRRRLMSSSCGAAANPTAWVAPQMSCGA